MADEDGCIHQSDREAAHAPRVAKPHGRRDQGEATPPAARPTRRAFLVEAAALAAGAAVIGWGVPPVPPTGIHEANRILSVLADRIRATHPANLLAYWPLWDTQGTSAEDASTNNRNGAFVGSSYALGQPGVGDGRTSVSVTADAVNLYSASLRDSFSGAAGTFMVWARVSAAGVWTDGTERHIAHFSCFDGANYIRFYRPFVNYQIRLAYAANGTALTMSEPLRSDIAWMHLALTWDAAANRVIGYINGRPIGPAATGLGAWTGTLHPDFASLGAQRTDSLALPFTGNLAHAALWDVALAGPEIQAIHDTVRPTDGLFCLGDSKTADRQWIYYLRDWLATTTGRYADMRPLAYGLSGQRVAELHAYVDANLAGEYQTPRWAIINIGANDLWLLPAQAAWQADLKGVIDPLRARWPGVQIWIAKPWRRGKTSASNTLAGWIDTVIATYTTGVYPGPDERVWLEGGDDGATYTTDGTHYSPAGHVECARQWLAAITAQRFVTSFPCVLANSAP